MPVVWTSDMLKGINEEQAKKDRIKKAKEKAKERIQERERKKRREEREFARERAKRDEEADAEAERVRKRDERERERAEIEAAHELAIQEDRERAKKERELMKREEERKTRKEGTHNRMSEAAKKSNAERNRLVAVGKAYEAAPSSDEQKALRKKANADLIDHLSWAFGLERIDVNDPQQVGMRISAYMKRCGQDGFTMSIVGMARALGMDRQTLEDHKFDRVGSREANDLIRSAYSMIEEIMETSMVDMRSPVSGIFIMKNNFGYRDEQDITVKGKAPERIPTDDELRKRYLADMGEVSGDDDEIYGEDAKTPQNEKKDG